MASLITVSPSAISGPATLGAHGRRKYPLGVIVVLAVVCLRIFGVSLMLANLSDLLEEASFSPQEAQSWSSLYLAVSTALYPIAAVLSDSYLGPFMTYGLSILICLLGASLIAVAGFLLNAPLCLIGMLFLSIGIAGGVCLVIVGVDQLRSTNRKLKAQENFFWYVLWWTQLGGIGVTAMSSADETRGKYVSFSVAAASTALLFMLFWACSCCFSGRFAHRGSKVFGPLAASLWHSAKKSLRGKLAVAGWLLGLLLLPMLALATVYRDEEKLQLATVGLLAIHILCLLIGHWNNDYLVEVASSHATLVNALDCLSVQEARLTFQTIPTLLVVVFPISFVSSLLNMYVTRQICQSDARYGNASQQIPSYMWDIANAIIFLVCLPMVMKVCKLMRMSMTSKFIVGYGCAILALLVLVYLEKVRKDGAIIYPPGIMPMQMDHRGFPMGPCKGSDGIDYCSSCAPRKGDAGVYMSDMSAFYYVVPNTLVSLTMMLVMPTTQYLACAFTPSKMRTVLQAFYLMVCNCYPSVLVTVFANTKFAPRNLNGGFVEVYYYIGLAILFVAAPFLCFRHHARVVQSEPGDLARDMCDDKRSVDLKSQALSGSTRFNTTATGTVVSKPAALNLMQSEGSNFDDSMAAEPGTQGMLTFGGHHSFTGAFNGIDSFTDDNF